jgi:phosphoribosylcarboxyaminoimidazole (NCAIR) mutase
MSDAEIQQSSETIHLMFGSTSDETHILPKVRAFSIRHPPLIIDLQYGSVDNTPKKVEMVLTNWSSEGSATKARTYATGAGMVNALTGESKSHYARLNDLVVGVPVTDKSSEGLTAFLSTFEKPPFNPVVAVGLNNADAALEIVYRFKHKPITNGVERVIVPGAPEESYDLVRNEFYAALKDFGIFYDIVDLSEIGSTPNEIVLNPFCIHTQPSLRQVDKRLAETQGGIQIAYPMVPIRGYTTFYAKLAQEMGEMRCTGIVTSLYPVNAAIVAAQLTRNEDALRLIKAKREERAVKIEKHKGLTIINREVTQNK